ncbi:Fur family transcriptional regulator [Acanthopleuribacter pedis]|uniref:Transcriptional repressor n=1 Tax=Acanthopleuribacter pedis TaxID=442870 RepID=A0A8J7Q5X3_9BACT|nr:Fur family transcriptional regulator [Acanthopleuribacter pedis]MBO1318732.1 transcriptional repressor [Acanthopleuribacter pedis]
MIRSTKQRAVIREVFEKSDRPLSPQDVMEAVEDQDQNLGIATVYRTLKMMKEQGYLVAVELPGQPTFYERAEHEHHHHFQCDECGIILDVPGCLNVEKLTDRLENCEINRHEIWLFGRCSECRKAS